MASSSTPSVDTISGSTRSATTSTSSAVRSVAICCMRPSRTSSTAAGAIELASTVPNTCPASTTMRCQRSSERSRIVSVPSRETRTSNDRRFAASSSEPSSRMSAIVAAAASSFLSCSGATSIGTSTSGTASAARSRACCVRTWLSNVSSRGETRSRFATLPSSMPSCLGKNGKSATMRPTVSTAPKSSTWGVFSDGMNGSVACARPIISDGAGWRSLVAGVDVSWRGVRGRLRSLPCRRRGHGDAPLERASPCRCPAYYSHPSPR